MIAAHSDEEFVESHLLVRTHPVPPRRTAHAAHGASHADQRSAPPGGARHVDSPEIRELLESLDDAIFAALGGCPSALENALRLWPSVVAV